VVVVADPQGTASAADQSTDVVAFRKYTVGVITHGGLQPKHWEGGPPWELRMAAALHAQGYDTVIPFNWVSDSTHPGAVVREGKRLERVVLNAVDQLPTTDPVDVHFIGHSEGAVVDSQALLRLQEDAPATVRAGYMKFTVLDPHPANNHVVGHQYSVSHGLLGWIAKLGIKAYQARAKDPAVVVPPIVDSAEVFYQHTPVSQTHTSNHGVYNLWGQVPVIGPAHYYNITGEGVSHSGRFGVQNWYQVNVVPTLGSGATFLHNDTLTASLTPGVNGPAAEARRATYSGTAAPGAKIRLLAGPIWTRNLARVGQAVAGPDGSWSLTTQPLAGRTYRVIAVADSPDHPLPRPLHMAPTVFLPTLSLFPLRPGGNSRGTG
jgi:hypothetical protein